MPQDAHRHLRHDPELTLRTNGEPEQVVALRVEIIATELSDLSIHQNHLDFQDVVRRHPIFEAMRSACIHGDISADRACELARRIGGIKEPGMRHGIRNAEIGNAGLDGRCAIEKVHIENPVHARQAYDDCIATRQCAAAERGASSSRDDSYIIFTAKLKNAAYFRRRSWQYNGKRNRTIGCKSIGLESAKAGFIAYDGVRSKRAGETAQDLFAAAKN